LLGTSDVNIYAQLPLASLYVRFAEVSYSPLYYIFQKKHRLEKREAECSFVSTGRPCDYLSS
jgi:hypothetical protein